MIRRPPRSTLDRSSAASDVYKRQSVVKATRFLKKQKCKRVFVVCTHGLLVGDAEKNIKKAGVTQIISTNTIPRSISKVDVSGVIAQAVQ